LFASLFHCQMAFVSGALCLRASWSCKRCGLFRTAV
jgi:hypothetical protein